MGASIPENPCRTRKLEDFGSAFFKHADAMAEAPGGSELMEPARRFVHVFKREAERPVMHGNKPFGAQVLKNLDGFVRAHVYVAEGFGPIGADRQEGDFGGEVLTDLFKTVEVGAVTGVIDFAALMFEDEAAVAAVMVAQHAGTPMFAGRERDLPVAMGKTLPPIEFDDALEAE